MRAATATAAVPPMARALVRTPTAGLVVLSVTPLITTVLRGGDDLRIAVVVAAVAGGACAGGCVEDAAERTVAASPTPRPSRRALRLALVAVSLALAWSTAAATAGAAGVPIGPLEANAAAAAAAAGLSLAVATLYAADDAQGADLAGAGAAIMAVLVSTSLNVRFSWMPALGQDTSTRAWWILALAGWTGAAWLNRDPATRAVVARPRCARSRAL